MYTCPSSCKRIDVNSLGENILIKSIPIIMYTFLIYFDGSSITFRFLRFSPDSKSFNKLIRSVDIV